LTGKDVERLAQLCEKGTRFLASLKDILGLFAPPPAPLDQDPWRILGVNPEDPPELVKAVYRAKSKVLHPDAKGTGNADAFKRMRDAYEEIQRQRAAEGERHQTKKGGEP